MLKISNSLRLKFHEDYDDYDFREASRTTGFRNPHTEMLIL